MKHFLQKIFSKASDLLERDPATRDRSSIFRITVLTLVTISFLFIVFYTLKLGG